MEHGGHKVSRAEYEANLAQKFQSKVFFDDLVSLLAAEDKKSFNFDDALRMVQKEFLILLP